MMVQVEVRQLCVMGLPPDPPTGVALTTYGPRVPVAGDTMTAMVVAPVAPASTAGAPAPGVVTTLGDDAAVEAPVEPMPRAVSW